MPLLKKKSFEKVSVPEFLRDDEEVFHCEMTNEIFRDYDEFCQRIILCNSMVWSCSITGKSGLTYAEALESEDNAKRNLRDFPKELRLPVLYLATKTRRTAFGDMAEDVFTFVKDHFFIGESVEASFGNNKWKESQIMQVIAPTEAEIKKSESTAKSSLYKYQVEQIDAYDKDISEVMILDPSQIRRKKGLYNREKNKLFIKQHTEISDTGVFKIKESVLKTYNMSNVKFSQIFDGPVPDFEASKKSLKAVNGKKVKQETLAKFLTKNGLETKKADNGKNLLEEMKRKEQEYKEKREQLKQQKAEEKLAEKQKRREENVKISMYLRDWYRPKEDLELEDHKEFPNLTAVESKIEDKYLGDVFMIMDFAKTFTKFLHTNKYFPGGLSFEIMERALTECEIAGPLIDILQMLLVALFDVQTEEASQYKTVVESSTGIKVENLTNDRNLTSATYLATKATKYIEQHHGKAVDKLPLYPLTASEILRLHFLSSGARINDLGARWRYQERGGYTSEDDPGLHFRVHQPHILKALAQSNVVELPIDHKLKIISCLMHQLLTYADVRDAVEERIESSRQAKLELRSAVSAERGRDQEYRTTVLKLKKLAKEKEKVPTELENLKKVLERKQVENERKIEKLMKVFAEHQVLMGQDRAFRKYLRIAGIPGVFISFEEDEPGVCLSDVVKQNKDLVDADRTEILAHIRKIHDEFNTSDKENNPKVSPKKPNGVKNGLIDSTTDECKKLLLCSADPESCTVHSKKCRPNKWYFVKDEQELEALIYALNKRGIRESELLHMLQNDKDTLAEMIKHTPVVQLNPALEAEESEETKAQRLKQSSRSKYNDANLGFAGTTPMSEILHLTLTDLVLEMEEKLHSRHLGCLKVPDREKWRDCLANGSYDKMDKTTAVIVENGTMDEDDGETTSRSSSPEGQLEDENDPGKYLLDTVPEDADEDNKLPSEQNEEIKNAMRNLAIALLQVAQSIEHKYFNPPLGLAGKKGDGRALNVKFMERWQQSLLASTSYSQIFLHYATLDSSIRWSCSTLKAKCRVCRRARDHAKMLLCDTCNLGHHLYCLKPKLKEVPPGEWFCDKCLQAKREEEAKAAPPVPKKRRIFRDEDIEDEDEIGDIKKPRNESDSEEEVENKEKKPAKNGIAIDVCDACGFGGELLCCDSCPSLYHCECVTPPLRRVPRGSWYCNSCKDKKEKSRSHSDRKYANNDVVQRPGIFYNQRRCAAKAQLKIHGFIKSLRRMSESEDSDSDDAPIQRRSLRRDDGRNDLPLHNAALHELLTEVMKNKDAWPFLRPVQKYEVPDYYEVISKPMDFGTIKYKLNMGEYQRDAEFMADAVLVFENCNTYNDSDADVYKCGVRLLKLFEKKSKELGLQLPEEMEEEEISESKQKKRRTK